MVHFPFSTPPLHYYEQLLMADRLSLRLVRPSKMDELQSEKLSGATGQPGRLDQFIRQLRLFSAALAAFVLAASGREMGISLPSVSLSLFSSPSRVWAYLHAVAWRCNGSREHRHDNLEWRKKLSGDVDTARDIVRLNGTIYESVDLRVRERRERATIIVRLGLYNDDTTAMSATYRKLLNNLILNIEATCP